MRTYTLSNLAAVILTAAAGSAATAMPVTQANPPAASAPSQVQVADAAQAPPITAARPAPAMAAPADKKICKQLPSSYSRVTVRTCLTAKEWKQVDEQSRD